VRALYCGHGQRRRRLAPSLKQYTVETQSRGKWQEATVTKLAQLAEMWRKTKLTLFTIAAELARNLQMYAESLAGAARLVTFLLRESVLRRPGLLGLAEPELRKGR
jgi:hypothetical protein